jgi:hypothetical protein
LSEALERGAAEFVVHAAVVLAFDPGERRVVEHLERQRLDALEHGQQAALDLGPEDLLLGILIGRVRQRGLVHDAEAREPLGDLRGGLGAAVVGQQGSWQAARLQRLRQTVDEALGVLGQIPLGVTAQMEVGVPQRAHVRELVAAHLARGQMTLRGLGARRVAAHAPRPTPHPVRLQVPAHRRVRRHRTERRIGAGGHREVVHVQLHAPARMRLVLSAQHAT